MAKKANNVVPIQQVESLIYLLRGQKAMLDSDLAALYGVPTKVFNQAVRRNRERFPDDFMFQLSEDELERFLRSQIVTSKKGNRSHIAIGSEKIPQKSSKSAKFSSTSGSQMVNSSITLRSQIVTSKDRRGGRRFRPYVFTEQGIAMLSNVLRSQRAVQVNIEIMRAFVKIRQWLASNADLARRLDEMENKFDRRFKIVFDAIRELTKPLRVPKREIGFHAIPAEAKENRRPPAKQK